MMLDEPDVALTDFALAVECAVLAAWLWRYRSDGAVGGWFVVFFAALGTGSLLGGLTHGFFSESATLSYRVIWSGTLLAIGVAALACWALGARLLFPERIARRFALGASALYAIYALVILAVSQSFAVAIVHYLPPLLFLLLAFVQCWRVRRANHLLAGVAGFALSLVAAATQQAELGLVGLGLTHNAVYHIVQGIAFLLIFLAARGEVRKTS